MESLLLKFAIHSIIYNKMVTIHSKISVIATDRYNYE